MQAAPDPAVSTAERYASVIDEAVLADQITELTADASSGDDAKRIALDHLHKVWDDGRADVAAILGEDPFSAPQAIRAYTAVTDAVVRQIWHLATMVLYPNPNPTSGEQMALLAVGGYGRAEMAPFSDIDLLFLNPYKTTAWGESVIEATLYMLWDLNLKVGQAVRTVDECIRLGRDDLTIRTALLENRFLAGNRDLSAELDERLWKELFSTTGPEFVAAKLVERSERHQRHGGSRYLVEPNVKEGKGGLRDLQTLYWIAKYLNRAKTPEDLVKQGVFTAEEMKTFSEAENFLWSTRCQLHLVAGRPTEKMTFDTQVEIAQRLGFEDTAGQRAVERFMQTYFTYARRVGELTRIFLVALEAEHVKERPGMARTLMRVFRFGGDNAPDGYEIKHGRIDMVDHDAFARDPVNIFRLVHTALDTGYLIHADAMRRIALNLHLIDDRVRRDEEANRLFLDCLLHQNDPVRALRRMNEMGILGAFIPEFGRVVAMMQFNMYHQYTVDEHTIQCIDTLYSIEQRDLVEELPVASSILEGNVNRRVLYVALFLHDIGKGLPRDHSEAGAEIAEALCPRLGLPPEEVETVVWLVRNHLLMSDVAQKRDLTDERTVRDFAATVKSPARLKLLTVLTVCDIRGVGPGVWNNWKAVLLRQLYAETLSFLTGSDQGQTRPERIAEAQSEAAALLPNWRKATIEREFARHYPGFWLGLDPDTQAVFVQMIREVKPNVPKVQIDRDDARDATRVCFAMHDHPGLFSRLAGALALVGANVVDARTYTSRDGIATPVFWIQDREGHPFEAARLTRLRKVVNQALAGDVVPRDALRDKDKVRRRERDFVVPSGITFNNEGSDIYTMIEVDTRDRPGLLYDLTRVLADNHISIHSAIIATYGEQAVDTFYVKDMFGLKIRSQSKRDAIAGKLMDAILQGAERASA